MLSIKISSKLTVEKNVMSQQGREEREGVTHETTYRA